MTTNRNEFAEVGNARANNFDFIRFILATLVVWSHDPTLRHPAPGQSTVAAAGNGAQTHSLVITSAGPMAVNFFFVISGFLIVRSWLHSKSGADFFKKRLLRIYPGLAAAMLLCVLIVGPLGGAHLPGYFVDPRTYQFFQPLILLQTTGLPHVFEHSPLPGLVNVSLWTIRYEIICYVIVALLGWLGCLKKRQIVFWIFTATYVLFNVQMVISPFDNRIPAGCFGFLDDFPRFLTFFLAGSVFYLYQDRIPVSRTFFLISLLLVRLAYNSAPGTTLPLFGSYALFYLAFRPNKWTQDFAKRGDLSYGIYLYGFPTMQLVIVHLGAYLVTPCNDLVNRLILFAVVYGITLLLARLSWIAVEKPFLRFK